MRSRDSSPCPASRGRSTFHLPATSSGSSLYAELSTKPLGRDTDPMNDFYNVLDPANRNPGLPHGEEGIAVYHLLRGSKPSGKQEVNEYNKLSPPSSRHGSTGSATGMRTRPLPPIIQNSPPNNSILPTDEEHIYHTIDGRSVTVSSTTTRIISASPSSTSSVDNSEEEDFGLNPYVFHPSVLEASDSTPPPQRRLSEHAVFGAELLQFPWFHKRITREKAKALLANCNHGAFLVREKDANSIYALSVRRPGGVVEHHLIRRAQRTDGKPGRHFVLNNTRLHHCCSVAEAVEYLLQQNGSSGLPCLTTPLPREPKGFVNP